MKAQGTEGFIQDFSNLEKNIQKEVKDKIKKLEEQSINIEEEGLASNQKKQIECWKLKVKNKKAENRAIFDIINGNIILKAVGHRDQIYENKKWKEVAKRLRKH